MTEVVSGPDASVARRRGGAAARWLAPADQPPWARPALLAVAALAAALYAWNITRAGYSPFYSMAVKSMSMSWKALFYGAVDPSASLTIDKLAGSFVPQALSARVFGFHAWSLELPQVIEGTISVLVIYRVVRRWVAGSAAANNDEAEADAVRCVQASAAGLLAAGILAFTPVVASMFEHTMEDGALTVCMVLAVDRFQYAVMHGRLRSLLACAVWVGLGFQAKMLEAWMILPALAVGYLLTAPLPLRRRVLDTLAAGATTVAVSASWILLYTFTPTADRPYVDGSTDDNAFAMVFGYNGLGRLGIHVPGAVPPENTANLMAALDKIGIPYSALPNIGLPTSGWAKLVGEHLGPQIGWLYPLALISLAAGLWRLRRRPRTDVLRGGFVLWGTWLAVVAVVYSAMRIPHTAYLALLAPPIAALCAAGIVMFWRTWLLPVLVATETGWAIFLWHGYTGFLPWLEPAVIVVSVLAIIGTAVRAVTRIRRLGIAAAGLGVVAMLASPIAWAASTLDTSYSGTAIDATAGPDTTSAASADNRITAAIRIGVINFLNNSATLTPAEQGLLAYVEAHRGPSTTYLFATDSWLIAQPYVEADAAPVLPMGGFSGDVPQPTLAEVQDLVRTGRVSYFLLNPPGAIGMSALFGSAAGQSIQAIDAWIHKSCTLVQSPDLEDAEGPTGDVLYACGPQ
ncbi:MAG TPA: glycosyltransferase family 39 protein [Actinocrinis sp.]|jgi:4-amino-4-deoxy-L-arabinose transferase-like glycosyltransferase